MRVGYISQWFPPEPAHISLQIAEGLLERGHQVSVLTGFPNYPHGHVYEGYRQRFGWSETVRGLQVVRTPLIPNHGTSVLGRMANYGSFAASASLSSSKVPTPDVWLTYSSPALAALPPMLGPRSRRVPRALILQDLWPDSVVESSLLPRALRSVVSGTVGVVSTSTYRDADAVGVISPGMRDVLTARGVEPERIHYTPNWGEAKPLPSALDARSLRRELGLPAAATIFIYAGNLGDFQALDQLIEGFVASPSAHLLLVGDGASERVLKEFAGSLNATNVQFVDRQTQDDLARYLAASDVQVISLADRPLMRVTMPSKVQACLAAGKPILVHAVGDVADVVTAAGAGVAVNPGRADLLARAIASIVELPTPAREELGRNASRAFERLFSREVGISRVEGLLQAAVRRRSTVSRG